jgi:hypothetical protein
VVENIKPFAVGAVALALAGCLATGQTDSPRPEAAAPPSLEHPGTRITPRNPDPNKWVLAPQGPNANQQAAQAVAANAQTAQSGGANPQNNARVIWWVCRPMACADRAFVGIQMQQSPTRHPDRKALEKSAKVLSTQIKAQDMVAEAASEGDQRFTPLSTRVTELRGYPAIMAEVKQTSRGKANYRVRGDIFIGNALVKILAQSGDLKEARRYFDSFLTAIEILDVERPPAEPSQPSAPVALDNPAATSPANPGHD